MSNFLGRDFARLLEVVEIIPTVNQLERHVYRPQRDMRQTCSQTGYLTVT